MVNVILSSDNVTVLGGPSRLDVDLNIGATGRRGSLFFTGLQNPNFLNPVQDFPVVPIVFDVFINVNAASEEYLQAYQYVNEDGINNWSPIFSINQNVFSVNKVLNFVNGEASAAINISSLGLDRIPFESYTNSFSYFNVQATLNNIDLENRSLALLPSAVSVEVGDVYEGSEGSTDSGEFPILLPLTFKAVEFDGSQWSSINNKKVAMYLTISFANPNEIFSAIIGGNN
jgi:hypothetical protein